MDAFIRDAVALCNDRCFGNLSAAIIVSPRTQKLHRAAFQTALQDLRYGSVTVNGPPHIPFAITALPWGAWSSAGTLHDMGSGNCLNHNTALYDHMEKGVAYFPWTQPLTPVFFASHTNTEGALGACLKYYANRNIVSFHRVLFAALGSK